jgi:UDP-3-O-[3-hydroxymyristoyl] N-acetylglucosamine deacetylase
LSVPAGWHGEQGTLGRTLELSGRGLHTGRRVNVRIVPAEAGGIVFRRIVAGQVLADLPASPSIRLAQPLCTTLQTDSGVRVRTVEHLLASLLTCEIDHAVVELSAEEVPILDGSAQPWIQAITACGRRSLPARKRFIRVLKRVNVELGAGTKNFRSMTIEPAARYEMSVRNDLQGFGNLHWEGNITPAIFASDISPSRSYGRVKWAVVAIVAGYLRGIPILRGARLNSTAAIIGSKVIGGLRMPDEFVRHRVLDLVGDLALAGAPLLGRVTALRPSHDMNYRLLAALLADPGSWEWAEFPASAHATLEK